MEKLPKILGWTNFTNVGFYQFISMQDCTLKAMNKNLKLSSEMPTDLPTRKQLVGIFHHKLVEIAHKANSEDELDIAIEAEITKLQTKVKYYNHFQRTGSVSGWDEINRSVKLAFSYFRYKVANRNLIDSLVEIDLVSLDGLLKGRPDSFSIDGSTAKIKEIKTTHILDQDGEIKVQYAEQVKFYSVLLYDNFKIENVVGIIESFYGDKFEIKISKNESMDFKEKSAEIIYKANAILRNAKTITELARPSSEACATCNKRAICETYISCQFSIDMKENRCILRGKLVNLSFDSSGKLYKSVIQDEFQGKEILITIPAEDKKLNVNDFYTLTDLNFQSGKYFWTPTSRMFENG